MSEVTMLDYIRQTPSVVLNQLEHSYEYTKELVQFYLDGNYHDIVVVASGSSYNGSMCARTFMRQLLNTEVKMVTPFTFTSYEHQYIDHSLVLFVTQSGCSTNTLDAIKCAKAKGLKTVALVGRDDCDAKEIADITINWQCGEEKIGFVTKGVVSLAAFLMIFAIEAAFRKNLINEDKYHELKDEIALAMEIHPQLVDETLKKFEANFQNFTSKSNMYMLGTGPSYGVALEAALKISETNVLTAVAVETEEFIHGPIYPANPNTVIFMIDNNDDPTTQRSVDIAKACTTITERTYAITNSDQLDEGHCFRTTKQTSDHVSTLYKLACIETLAYMMTINTNNYQPHPVIKRFKRANAVASKSRANLYLDLQKNNQ